MDVGGFPFFYGFWSYDNFDQRLPDNNQHFVAAPLERLLLQSTTSYCQKYESSSLGRAGSLAGADFLKVRQSKVIQSQYQTFNTSLKFSYFLFPQLFTFFP
jgi:hypothetical protein